MIPKLKYVLFILFLIVCVSSQAALAINLSLQYQEKIINFSETDELSDTLMLIKEFSKCSWCSGPCSFFNINDELIFWAYSEVSEGAIRMTTWKSDGTEVGTVRLGNVQTNCGLPYKININGTIFFSGGVGDIELCKTDGTEEGTVLVKDIFPGGNSCPSKFNKLWDKLIFGATIKYGPPPEYRPYGRMFMSDGTSVDTLPASVPNVYLDGCYDMGKRALWFSVRAIYQFNESFEEFSIFKEFSSEGPQDGHLNGIYKLSDTQLYFFVTEGYRSGDYDTAELWVTDGTKEGTLPLKNAIPRYVRKTTNVNGTLFFSTCENIGDDAELWRSKGTTENTFLIKVFKTGSHCRTAENLIAFRDKLYFFSDNAVDGVELWCSDGIGNNTVLIKDINQSCIEGFRANMIVHNDYLFFTLVNENGITELWISDGTPVGTYSLKNLTKEENSSVKELLFINDVLYFSNYNDTQGGQLWKYVLPTELFKDPRKKKKDRLVVYPNPSKHILHFPLVGNDNHIIVRNMKGNIIYENRVQDSWLDISFLRPGIYIISINGTASRFIKTGR